MLSKNLLILIIAFCIKLKAATSTQPLAANPPSIVFEALTKRLSLVKDYIIFTAFALAITLILAEIKDF